MTTLPLGRLARAEVESLALATTDGRPFPAPLLDEIVARTDGVPLFVEELCKALLAAGVVVERGGQLELADRSGAPRFRARCATPSWRASPPGGRKAVAARLGLGREFAFPLSRPRSPRDPDLDTQLAVLTDAEYPGLQRTACRPRTHYVFKARAHPGGRRTTRC